MQFVDISAAGSESDRPVKRRRLREVDSASDKDVISERVLASELGYKELACCDWCFTINNPSVIEEAGLKLILEGRNDKVRYMIYQREKGEEGTEHLQGFIIMRVSRKLGWMKRNVSMRAHWEQRRESRKACIVYCSKEATRLEGPFVYGSADDVCNEDHSKDWTELWEEIKNGKTFLQLCDKFPGQCMRCHGGIRFAMFCHQSSSQRRWKTIVHLYYGKTGSGKTTRADEEAGPMAYWKPHGQWWDGYIGQPNVIIDDFYGDMPYSFFLRLLDSKPLIMENKGGSVQCLIKEIWITSNKPYTQWYKEALDNEIIGRRIAHIVRFEECSELVSVLSAANGVNREFSQIVEKGHEFEKKKGASQ